jgi:hypothetical protein
MTHASDRALIFLECTQVAGERVWRRMIPTISSNRVGPSPRRALLILVSMIERFDGWQLRRSHSSRRIVASQPSAARDDSELSHLSTHPLSGVPNPLGAGR